MVRSAAASASEARIAEPRGPLSAQQVRDQIDAARLLPSDEACLEGGSFWAPLVAWAPLALDTEAPARHVPVRPDLPHELAALIEPGAQRERAELRWWLRQGGQTLGPLSGAELE